ncbi:glycosyltransferase family 2 protein [Parasutterella secunda]|uniref:glycosyltransferase family 2 protein n=1 Tax=Parasutterella secunda TaxID=626947 RepID=UPI0025A4319B|nr:glycosyltransferase family 2 protein [Parasutterella secunda]MDM8218489.1 glycosyltransferase family 2 protein [Parasutterella secunda]
MDNDYSQSVILSVISPVYNGSKYLEPFLRSVLQQSFPHFELIMVDDGSTDSSVEIIKSYQKNDSRIHLIGQNHKGAGSARNFGLSQAKGQYIIFLDCDDWFNDDFFKTMIDRIEVDQSDIAVCEFFIYNQQTGETEKFVIPETRNQKIERINLVFDIFAPNPWTKLYRFSFLKKNELLFQEIPSCNDWSFAYTSLACAEKISVIREPLVYYRTKTNTSISSQRYKRTKDIVRAVQDLKRQLQLRGLYGCFKNGFARRSVNHLVWEAFSKKGVKVFYVLFRNLLMVNDFAVYKAFVQKVIQFLGKRLNKLIAR